MGLILSRATLVLSVLIFLAILFDFFHLLKDKHDIGESVVFVFVLEFMDQSDLFLLIMEHVNILKTVLRR